MVAGQPVLVAGQELPVGERDGLDGMDFDSVGLSHGGLRYQRCKQEYGGEMTRHGLGSSNLPIL